MTEQLRPNPKNIYGVTKVAAEDLCQLFYRNTGLPCIVVRTSRFFPDVDDDKGKRDTFHDDNLKANELLFRRVDIEDVVSAHLCALSKAADVGFDRFIISATTPFQKNDVAQLAVDAPSVVERYVPGFRDEFSRRHWQMFPTISRVYDNAHAREKLGWAPKFDFGYVIDRLRSGKTFQSTLAKDIGIKGYHGDPFENGPYPVGNF